MLTDSTFVAGQRRLLHLVDGASQRVKAAFRPKTRRCYQLLFRNFVGFCCLADILIQDISLHSVMAYLEYLALNKVSVHMVANNVAAIKANFVMYGIDHSVMEHPRVKYFLKSMRINRPLSVPVRNVMSLQNLVDIVHLCDNILFGSVFKAVFLIAFFGFLRISNIATHSIASFDPSRHLTASDVKISKNFMTLTIKWSKTNQNRDKIHYITLPILRSHPLCPVSALKNALSLYSPSPLDPLFQIKTVSGWRVLTDSRIRKVLSRLNKKWVYVLIISLFTPSGVQELLWLLMPMCLCKVSSHMAPGHRTVYGHTYSKTKVLLEILLYHLLVLSIMLNSTPIGPLRVL